MVLFDEDPVSLISETTTQFHIAPDKDSLSRITSSLSTLQSARQTRLDAHHTTLKHLSRRLNTLQSQNTFEQERHDAGKHASEMLRMDTEKFRVAKGVSEVEIEGERLGGELAGLKAQLNQLEREGVEGGGEARRRGRGAGGEAVVDEEDEVVLKLLIYRSLGIDVSQDRDTGAFNRAVIRNTTRGDVHAIDVDAAKPSRSFYANMFWDSL